MRAIRYVIGAAVAILALMFVFGCTGYSGPGLDSAQKKDILAKYRQIAGQTAVPAKMKAAAPPVATSVPTTPLAWTDASGNQYTLTPAVSYIPATPAVATNHPPTITTGPNTINSGYLASGNWAWQYDPGTPATATGTSSYPAAGISGNTARQFNATYTHEYSGELFHISFAKDPNATHFIYDTWIWVQDFTQIMNLELDMNQVVANGNTIILATQCAGADGTWDYTLSSGGSTHWVKATSMPCDPRKWTSQTWHHVQIATHHDAGGNVTYDWVSVDGAFANFPTTATGNSSYALGWSAGTNLINFQMDGANPAGGSITAKMDQTAVYRW